MSERDIVKYEHSSEIQTIDASSLSIFTPVIPEKSKMLYEKRYKQFKLWCRRKNAKSVTESVLLSYFTEKSKTLKSSSLWSKYSMLKTMLTIKEGLNIKKYTKVVSFLKNKSQGYSAQTSEVLTREQIMTFLEEADDEEYLMWKVVLIMGIAGRLRCIELAKMTVDDIEERDHGLIVTVSYKKVENNRTFTITNQDCIRIYRKYIALRPKCVKTRRLFLKYSKGTCLPVLVGVQAIGKIPSFIAVYLELPNVDQYTGHCFRISSAALQTNNVSSKILKDLERQLEADDSKRIEITNNLLYNCRFCLKLPQDTPFRLISAINSAYIQMILPEIDLTLTESPRICPDCLKSLENAYKFKTKCLETERQMKIINEENNKIKERVKVEVEVSDYEIYSSASNSYNENENDTSNENTTDLVDDKIQPKVEVLSFDEEDEEEPEKEEGVKTENKVFLKSFYEDNYNSINGTGSSVDQQFLPRKAKERYEKAYNVFDSWCKKRNIDNSMITEDMLLGYFVEQANNVKPTSLWSMFSMLKSIIREMHNVNISGYSKLIGFLKSKRIGFKSKKRKLFSREQVEKFLMEAPDEEFLMMKLALIVGLAGACQCDELSKLSLVDVDDEGDKLILKIPDIVTDRPRSFMVTKGDNGINISLYKKYLALRPAHTTHGRLFVSYRAGKCSIQPVGLHTFGKIPAKVASYLGLPQPELYTARSLQRTSNITFVDTGGVI